MENQILYVEEIASTHLFLKENYKKYENGTAIIAKKQTQGIGTKGRNWYTGKGNIAISILYKPDISVLRLEKLTSNLAKCIQRIVLSYGINLQIKEPNDLYLNGKKIAGILTEINMVGEKINFLIISVGFNVNGTNFAPEIQNTATSLKKEYQRDFHTEELTFFIIKGINGVMQEILQGENKK